MILCIETATPVCSVALCNRNGTVALKESGEDRSHASRLTIFIEEILMEAGIKAGSLEAVAVSKGPGSYTGLRIGVSTGKGIAYAASVPLISVDTTLSMFLGFSSAVKKKDGIQPADLFCPALDARRMEIYYSVYDAAGNTLKGISAEIVDRSFLQTFHPDSRLFVFGDGASKCSGIMERSNVTFDAGFRISAEFMNSDAYRALDNKRFEDVAYFEPFYLKDFMISKPVKNILAK